MNKFLGAIESDKEVFEVSKEYYEEFMVFYD